MMADNVSTDGNAPPPVDRRRANRRRDAPLGAERSAVLSVRLTNETFDRTGQLAAQDGVEVSELVRTLLQREIRQRLRRRPV